MMRAVFETIEGALDGSVCIHPGPKSPAAQRQKVELTVIAVALHVICPVRMARSGIERSRRKQIKDKQAVTNIDDLKNSFQLFFSIIIV